MSGLLEDMNEVATSPASDYLFKARNNAPKINKETVYRFHYITAQMLIVAQRGRPDLRTVYIVPE